MNIAEGRRMAYSMSYAEIILTLCFCTWKRSNGFPADVKFMTDLVTPCGRIYSMMVRGEQPFAILSRPDSGFHAKLNTFLDEDHVIIEPDMIGEICDRIAKLPGERPRVGVPTLDEYPKLMTDALLKTKAEIVDITDAFVVAKAPKAPYEIQLIKEASDLSLDVFEEVIKFIKPGRTEKEVIGFAEGYLRAHGAEDLLILCRGEYPHAFINRPTFRKIGPEDIFVFSVEIAGIYGYWTQIIRPIFMSKNSYKKTYDILCQVKEAINAGVEKFGQQNLRHSRGDYKRCQSTTLVKEYGPATPWV